MAQLPRKHDNTTEESGDTLPQDVRLREEFVTLASHELMTPLTSLMLQAQMLRRTLAEGRIPRPEQVAGALDLFDRQLGRLQVLSDDLVQAACIRADQLSLARKDVDLAALVRMVTARVAAQYPAARRSISVEADKSIAGRWDPAQIERVVLHLVRNAVAFGEGKPIEILVRAIPDGARIVVRDHGIGIVMEDQQRIFERFERAVPVNHYGGLGLGLYIVRAIVHAHGGAIQVESGPGRGATFTVDLPLAHEEHKPRAAPSRRGPGPPGRGATPAHIRAS